MSKRQEHAKITGPVDVPQVPKGSEAPGPENKYAASDSESMAPGFVKSTGLGSLAALVLAALKDGPASGGRLADRLERRRQDVMACCQELRRQGAIVRAGKAWALAPAARCAGNSQRGRCGREAAPGSRYCTLHADQDVPAPAPKARDWFVDDICDRRGIVFDALGFGSFPSVNELAQAWPRVRKLYNSERSTKFERTWNWLMDHDESFRITSLAAGDLFAAGKLQSAEPGAPPYPAPGSHDKKDLDELFDDLLEVDIDDDEPGEDPDDDSETIL